MKTLTLLLFLMVSLIPSVAFAAPYMPKDEITKKGDWAYVSIVLNKGADNISVIGKITYKGIEVKGIRGHALKLPFGRYVWRGPYHKSRFSGWISIASDLDLTEIISAELISKPAKWFYYTKKKSG